MTQTNQKSMIGQVFLISLITAMLIFVPAMIWDKGYFLFLGDFNSQRKLWMELVYGPGSQFCIVLQLLPSRESLLLADDPLSQ